MKTFCQVVCPLRNILSFSPAAFYSWTMSREKEDIIRHSASTEKVYAESFRGQITSTQVQISILFPLRAF
jgi:hypothetical protein